MSKLVNIYRICEESSGYIKEKPSYINNKNCFANFINIFGTNNLFIFADNTSEKTNDMIKNISGIEPIKISKGSPGHSFMHVYDWSLNKRFDDDDIIYYVEADYVHKPGSNIILHEGFSLGADYVTLYDHPDKYMNPSQGGNPFIEDNGEITRAYLSKSCHWKLTNSTTGTFAAKVSTLKRDYQTISRFANQPYWNDFHMFIELLQTLNRTLISPMPGYSTHGETRWLTPLINWEEIMNETIKEV